jgi:hypothetical protein
MIMDEALTRLGIPVADSALARRTRELIADVAAPFLVNHSVLSAPSSVGNKGETS